MACDPDSGLGSDVGSPANCVPAVVDAYDTSSASAAKA
jgi:hypothetical protein